MVLGGGHRVGEALDVATISPAGAVEDDRAGSIRLRRRQRDGLVESREVRLDRPAQAAQQRALFPLVADPHRQGVEVALRQRGRLPIAGEAIRRTEQVAALRRFGVERGHRHRLGGGHARPRAVRPAGRLVETHGLLVGRPGDAAQNEDRDGDDDCKRAPKSHGR